MPVLALRPKHCKLSCEKKSVTEVIGKLLAFYPPSNIQSLMLHYVINLVWIPDSGCSYSQQRLG